MTRGRHFIMVQSRLYTSGVILRDPLMECTVNTFRNHAAVNRWCRDNGCTANWDGAKRTFSSDELTTDRRQV